MAEQQVERNWGIGARPNISAFNEQPHPSRARRAKLVTSIRILGLVLLLLLFQNPARFADKVDAQPLRQTAQASPPASPPPGSSTGTYAFANASPLMVFDSAAMIGGHEENFEFGEAYEASEQSSEYVKIKIRAGKTGYVRSTHVTTMRSPRWVTTTSLYNRAERAQIQLWESAVKLKEFLSGINTTGSQWDYEEYFGSPPQFQLKLPIIAADKVGLLGGTRQVKFVSVLLPISREMHQIFEDAKSDLEKQLSLHFLVDVSGSTKGFAEPVITGIVKVLGRNEALRNRLRTIAVTTFGASRANRSSFLGKISLRDVENVVWRPPGVDQMTNGEREPLIDGLIAMNAGLQNDRAAAPVLIILSGADVELESYARGRGKAVTIENLKFPQPNEAAAIFAQITPEPSEELRDASRRLRNVSRRSYVEYSGSLVEDLGGELIRLAENQKPAVETFGSVAIAAHKKHMMAFLPRALTPISNLPAPEPFATQSDWYSVRLWLTLDELIWKETAQ